ncbi:MAG: transporter permease [Chloroflexi bacterium]|nr:transporter permease [Chloroflexota bacterium]
MHSTGFLGLNGPRAPDPMTFAAAVLAWIADPAHWVGFDGIPTRVGEHLTMSVTALALSLAIALPVGLALGHTGKGGAVAINIANVGRALPSLALIALALPVAFGLGLGLGFWPTMFALVPLGLPPIITNTYVALRSIDPDLIEAARGMGMREWDLLRRVEIPVAAPVIIAGVRNAAVAIVATATLGAIVASGGLGRYIVDGLARQDQARLFVGAVLVALLAIGAELALALFERLVVPVGIRHAARAPDTWSAPR